jgi:DNA invertase Pin-like site-specific DNA recombinase
VPIYGEKGYTMLEAGMISARTKAALAAARRRGVKLGGDRGVKPSTKMHKASQAAIQARADARASDVAPVIAELQASGATSLRAIADGLNTRKIPTARGNGEWKGDTGDARSGTQRSLSGHDPRPGGGIGASVRFEARL